MATFIIIGIFTLFFVILVFGKPVAKAQSKGLSTETSLTAKTHRRQEKSGIRATGVGYNISKNRTR